MNAEADVYGGGSTTLGLVVTSAHPRQAGVQNTLADLLLERGARVDAGIVRSCLANGCPEAATHLAKHLGTRGVALTLEEAAGLGRLDAMAPCFEPPRHVPASEGAAALVMASWYDQRDAVSFLLDRGVDVGATAKDGQTALHVAAYRGRPELVELLLTRGAPPNLRDAVHQTPPFVWAMHAWLVERRADADAYRSVLRLLSDAGADVEAEWLEDDRLRADVDLYAALARRAGETGADGGGA